MEILLEKAVKEEKAAEIHVAQTEEERPTKILLVEDNPMNQMLMKMLVKNWKNTSMDIANNGQEGVDMLQKESYDMVLMDLQMPVMDGFEAIETIRAGKAGNSNTGIPIIAVTADITPKTRAQVLQLGADDYATKPVDEAVLREKMDALLHANSAA